MTEISKKVQEFADSLGSEAKVLDVGCGLRPYEQYFLKDKDGASRYTGIDVAQSGRSTSGKLPDIEFDGTNIPFEDGRFDAVLCTEVLEHAEHPEKLIAEIYRVLKSEGRVMLTVPFIWGLHELPYDFRRYTVVGITKALTNSGFKLQQVDKLTKGIDAIEMLVLSEMNNYKVNISLDEKTNNLSHRLLSRVQIKIFRLLLRIWRKQFVFDRIYIDNLVIAIK